ncbi:unnamed protein product [Ixodes pacificus]
MLSRTKSLAAILYLLRRSQNVTRKFGNLGTQCQLLRRVCSQQHFFLYWEHVVKMLCLVSYLFLHQMNHQITRT